MASSLGFQAFTAVSRVQAVTEIPKPCSRTHIKRSVPLEERRSSRYGFEESFGFLVFALLDFPPPKMEEL